MAFVKVTAKVNGKFDDPMPFMRKFNHSRLLHKLHQYGQMGVDALAEATPKDTGLTAASWRYEVYEANGIAKLRWLNDNLAQGKNRIPVVILIQNGHITKGGHYIEGIDFINPAIQPILDALEKDIWMEVTKGE